MGNAIHFTRKGFRASLLTTNIAQGSKRSGNHIDIGEKHTVTSLLPDCALAVHSSMSACDSMQAAITLTCMARNSLTLFEHIRK